MGAEKRDHTRETGAQADNQTESDQEDLAARIAYRYQLAQPLRTFNPGERDTDK